MYARQKRYRDSEALALAAYEGYNGAFGANHDLTQKMARQLAALYDAWGRSDDVARWRARLR